VTAAQASPEFNGGGKTMIVANISNSALSRSARGHSIFMSVTATVTFESTAPMNRRRLAAQFPVAASECSIKTSSTFTIGSPSARRCSFS